MVPTSNFRGLVAVLLLVGCSKSAAEPPAVERGAPPVVAEPKPPGNEKVPLEEARRHVATLDTARYINEHTPTIESHGDALGLLTHSVKSVPKSIADGLWVEFGVFEGKTINHIAPQIPGEIHGFDSFEGLPEDWRTGFKKGTFAIDGLPPVADNVKLHKGWFSDSVPKWAEAHPGSLAFVHFDADLYSSTKTVFDLLGDRFVVGTVMQFDEYWNYPGWQQGEFKALAEFAEAHDVKFEYLGYATEGNAEQVAVRITAIGNPATPPVPNREKPVSPKAAD